MEGKVDGTGGEFYKAGLTSWLDHFGKMNSVVVKPNLEFLLWFQIGEVQ